MIYYKSKNYRSGYCPECKNNFVSCKNRTLGEYKQKLSVKNKHPSWMFSHIRIFNRNWNKHLTKLPCQKCGYTLHIELAHIRPISDFPDSATLAEINQESNILALCPNHHWEFDNSFIKICDLKQR